MSSPAITIITPALNSAATLRTAIDSVTNQSVPYEALLVDGGSSDDTVAIASAAENFRVISAPGTSIYQALNRGIEEARAPVVVFLNSDDALVPGALAAWLEGFARRPDAEISRGWATFVEMNVHGVPVALPEDNRRGARPLDLHLLLRGACAINSLCVKRSVFDRIGMFDCTFRLAADRDWMLRVWAKNIVTAEIGAPVYRYLVHNGSSTLDRERRNFALIRSENMTIGERYLGARGLDGAPPGTRRAVERWYAAEAAMLVSRHAQAGDWRSAKATIGRAVTMQRSWPLMAGGEFVRWAWRRVG